MNFFLDSALLGLEYALLAVGVYITFRILNLPDLTVDGSFTFGMVVSTVLCAAAHPFAGLLAGALAGAVAGLVTGFLQTHCKIHPILAGILTMSGLYTVNITVLGGRTCRCSTRPSSLRCSAAKRRLSDWSRSWVSCSSRCSSRRSAACASVRQARTRTWCAPPPSTRRQSAGAALALANALVALSGAILAQCQGFGDVGAVAA